ncbi:MAG: glycosyltransferase [Pseudomonadota bacterium]
MNICAIIVGDSENSTRTMASLSGFDNLTAFPCRDLAQIDFKSIDSEYIFFIKNGDALSDYAKQCLLFNLALKDSDILYSDEAIIDNNNKKFNFYKPDYSPELILSMNYFRNLLCIKTSLLKEIKTIDSVCYENFLYELVLKILPKCKTITHIDEVLYHGYSPKNKVSYEDFYTDFDQVAGRKLLENYCQDNAIEVQVLDARYHGTYRLKYVIQGEPLISIVIPFKDMPELLDACITSILEKSTYKNFEIIGIDNGSKKETTLKLMQALKQKDLRVQFHSLDIPFNYSVLNNEAVNQFAKGEHIIFLNNDTEVIKPEWIEAMLEHSQRPQVGVVGAKLLYPDHSIQHCGMILGGLVLHAHRQLPDNQPGYFYFPHVVRNYHAVTFACTMMKTALFKEVGGLNETLKIACNDVDICARVSELGYYNVYTPYAVLYHYESKSRGMDDTPEKIMLADWERDIAAKCTPALFLRDSFYNKHLTRYDDDFSEGIREDIKGFALLFFQRLRRRYRELGFSGVGALIVKRLRK